MVCGACVCMRMHGVWCVCVCMHVCVRVWKHSILTHYSPANLSELGRCQDGDYPLF